MAKRIKLGVIGMSEGNGHPYSWSAIFNGYNPEIMKDCPFPAIPEYLSKQNFPEDSLGEVGEVTHIWTQDGAGSEHIAKASRIEHVVDKMQDIIGKVDAVLLARDDAENHYKMALPFLEAGLPIFIDKPLALSEEEANKIFAAQKYGDQIFTCSSLRYAQELQLTDNDLENIGVIYHVEASVPKTWDTYAVHLIEPMISQLPQRGLLKKVIPLDKNDIKMCMLEWENISAYIKVTGNISCPLKIEYFGSKGNLIKTFFDLYNCFKNSLKSFIKVIHKQEKNIPRSETMEIIRIIENGRS